MVDDLSWQFYGDLDQQTKHVFVVGIESGWWFEPLCKILVNWDDYSQYNGKRKVMFQTSNQYSMWIEKVDFRWTGWIFMRFHNSQRLI